MIAKSNGANYRWYLLTLAALTHTFAVAMPMMSLPVLFKEISEDLNLSLVQVGMLWGMIPLAGLFVVLIGGLLGDRFGGKTYSRHTLSPGRSGRCPERGCQAVLSA